MSDDYGVDLDEVHQVIDSAQVMIVRFHILPQRLLVDYRTKPGYGPMMKLVDPAGSVEARFRSIKELRPQFPYPERVMSFNWPRMMGVLVASGVWQRMVDRAGSLGGQDAVDECSAVLAQMMAEERGEVANAIRGADHYQTLWERQRA
jgi:hypothetical protein